MIEIVFMIITLLSIILFWLGTGKDTRVMIFLSGWMTVCGILAYSGFFKDTKSLPPRMILVVLPSVGYVIYFYRRLKAGTVRMNYLLALHVLRVPVEIVLYRLYLNGKIPVIMTFKGWNFDILFGITALALLVCSWTFKQKIPMKFFKLWNSAGIVFLAVIVITALLSAPSPIQWLAFEQPNTAILAFPYTLLPAVVVPLVLLSHLLCLRKEVTSPPWPA